MLRKEDNLEIAEEKAEEEAKGAISNLQKSIIDKAKAKNYAEFRTQVKEFYLAENKTELIHLPDGAVAIFDIMEDAYQQKKTYVQALHEIKTSNRTVDFYRKHCDTAKLNIIVIGDSTIDNKIWVFPGLEFNYFLDRLPIKRDSSDSRIEQNNHSFVKPELSVIENLTNLLPDYAIHDFTNDGFTSLNCLYGASRDKVFGKGKFKLFPNVMFKPLKEGQVQIQNSDIAILSIGGNDFREFLQNTPSKNDLYARKEFLRNYWQKARSIKIIQDENEDARKQYINQSLQFVLEKANTKEVLEKFFNKFLRNIPNLNDQKIIERYRLKYPNMEKDQLNTQIMSDYIDKSAKNPPKEIDTLIGIKYINDNFASVFSNLKNNYLNILGKIRALNPHAKIILMTQYYPSARQNNYKIYPFMIKLGKALGLGSNPNNAMDVIHELMKKTYSDILNSIQDDNIVVADITSSLNPFNNANHVRQIEPSGTGGKKIAQMLKYVIEDNDKNNHKGKVYRFLPAFFTEKINTSHVEKYSLVEWSPKHPYEFTNQACYDIAPVISALNAGNPKEKTLNEDQLKEIHSNEKLRLALIVLFQTAAEFITCENIRKILANAHLQKALIAAHGYLNSGRFGLLRTHGKHGREETKKFVLRIMESPDNINDCMKDWLRTSNVHHSSRAFYALNSGFFNSLDKNKKAYINATSRERRELLKEMLNQCSKK